jgi:hypothetical protein
MENQSDQEIFQLSFSISHLTSLEAGLAPADPVELN